MNKAIAVAIGLACFPALAADRGSCYDRLRSQLPTSDPEPKSLEFPALDSAMVGLLVINGYSVVAEGDFDGDKRQDVAFLIDADIPRTRMVAACLTRSKKIDVVRSPCTAIGIATQPKQKGDTADFIKLMCSSDKESPTIRYIDGQLRFIAGPEWE